MSSFFTRKTWKREIAFGAIMFWAVVTIHMFWNLEPDKINALNGAYSMISSTVWLFAAAAFGIDTIVRQFAGAAYTPPEPVARRVPGMDRRATATTSQAAPATPLPYE